MNLLIISGVILLIGFFIFGLLLLKAKKKHRAITHYEEIRDKLTIREAEEETGITEDEYEGYEGYGLGNIIRGFVALFIGVSLLPTITTEIEKAALKSSMTPSAMQILNFVPFFFGIGLLFIVMSTVYRSLKSSGLI